MSWELWVDYQRRDRDGLTHASVKDVSLGVALKVGGFVVVGNEEADPAVAEIVSMTSAASYFYGSCRGRARIIAIWFAGFGHLRTDRGRLTSWRT
jgi:hypothetical protein